MPVNKKKEEQHDPLKKPTSVEEPKPAQAKPSSQPLATAPRFSYSAGGQAVFDSPIAELIQFGGMMLARCQNDAMFCTTDGKQWYRFIFEIRPLDEEV